MDRALGPRLIEPLAAPPDGTIAVPGSKSHTNRALIAAALAEGTSTLGGVLFADDTRAMLRTLDALGIGLEANEDERTVVVSGGIGKLSVGPITVDAGQSGTTSRFAVALAALGPGPYTIDGHDQLRARPIAPLVTALRSLGASIEGDSLPVTVLGGGFQAGPVAMSGSVSSQFLSAVLLAAPGARSPGDGGADHGTTVVSLDDQLVSKPYVTLTIETMADFGVEVANDDFRRFTVAPQTYKPADIAIEPDASAASYFLTAAAITGGRVRIEGLGRRSVQGDVAFADVLERMGAKVEKTDEWIEVRGGSELRGVDIDMSDISDTAQTLAVVATFASGPTRVRGIDFIAKKEIDRVSAVVDELTKLGIRAERTPGGFTIHPGRPTPGTVTTQDDHRMAMSFALLGLVHDGIEIDDPGCVAKTFPDFFDVLDQLR